ncbi:MAG TPA: family 2A encapsulin nanocompartment cargo protein cysteine desulfurase [Terriglobales bacterium]
MSTNTTSTSNGNGNGNGASRPKRKAAGEGSKRQPFASIPLPEPEVLERLANEFFLVLPQDLADGNGGEHGSSVEEAAAEEIPTVMFDEGSFPSRETPRVEPGAAAVSSPGVSTRPGPLTEADFRAIAASLAGYTAMVPGTPGTAPAPPVSGTPPGFLAEANASPLAVAPALPPGNELFSFGGVPGLRASAPTAPPSGIDAAAVPATPAAAPVVPGSMPYFVEGEKGTSPGAASVLPPVSDLFGFPRVPAMPNAAGIQTIPNPPAPPASPSAAPPAAGDGTAVPGATHDVKSIAPQVPTGNAPQSNVPAGAAPGVAAPSGGMEQAVYPGMASAIPSASELFSFPGMPGMQSAPMSVPGGPSANPTSGAAPSGAAGVSPSRGVAEKTAGVPSDANTKLPTSSSAYEFRPDLEPADLGVAKRPLDAELIRRDFPILEERVHGRPLVWLDNAATTQKPNAVIDRISSFYRHENSNIHRAAHELAARATDAYESAREKSRRFLNASTTREIVFVRGATEGINLVAQAWGRRNVREGDEIVITWLEHHANIVPWQMLCAEKGAKLRVAPVNDRGEIILEEYERLLGPRTRMVAFPQVSNALGTIVPAREMTEIAHRYGARVLVDGAQAVSHMPVDVQTLGCDFYVFSGHKVFGPTGIGVVYGKLDLLDSMAPWQGGGNMIADVTFEKTTYQPSPARFEAGTGNIADAVGLGAALDYVDEIGRENIAAYEHDLLNYGTQKLLTVPGLRLIGTAAEKAGVMSFVLDEVRTEDVGAALNEEGIAVRSGHHCAQPILRRMGVEATVRPSLAFYNTCEDIDALVAALLRLQAARGHR